MQSPKSARDVHKYCMLYVQMSECACVYMDARHKWLHPSVRAQVRLPQILKGTLGDKGVLTDAKLKDATELVSECALGVPGTLKSRVPSKYIGRPTVVPLATVGSTATWLSVLLWYDCRAGETQYGNQQTPRIWLLSTSTKQTKQ